MGLFSRKNTVAAGAPAVDRIVVGDAELTRVRELLAAFEQQAKTGGTRHQMDAAVTALARAGSRSEDPVWASSERDFMIRLTECASRNDFYPAERSWHWLGAVAESAAQRGDHRLAARCVGFATWWLLVQTPQSSPASEQAMRVLKGIPDAPCGRILSVGLRVIPRLPPAELLIDDAPSHENTISARDALRITAFCARDRTAHLAPDVSTLPSRILSG